MAIATSSTGETGESNSIDTETTATDDRCTYSIVHDCRAFVTDPSGKRVKISRLTAYAEHGKEIHENYVHHEIPILKIDAPAFLDSLSPKEHGQLHDQEDKLREVNGIPLVRAEP